MNRDILSEASHALREEYADRSPGDRFTRARVMASLHQRRQRRSQARVAFIPLAAILVGSTAWAGATGRLPEVVRVLTHRPPSPVLVARAGLGRAMGERARIPFVAIPPPAAEPSPPRSAPSASRPDELPLYRAAHHAHFEAHDPATALQRWDEYLRVAPGGRLAVEARYNRALCLVRLGRREEAQAALTPFAQGAFGEYRQREAQDLIRTLGAQP
jgi:hypothetical protein